MKNNTQGFNDHAGCVSQNKLSFYEENYILEPEDITADNHYFEFEGDFDSDAKYLTYDIVA